MPLNPGKEPFHQPAPFITTQASAILCLGFYPIPALGCDHLNTVLAQFVIQLVAVIRAITNRVLGLCLDHVEVEAQLYQSDLMVVRCVGAHRQRQPVTVDNCHEFHTLTTLGRPDLITVFFGRGTRCIDKAFRFIQRTFCAQRVGKIDENIARDFVTAPLLKAAMHRFVVRVALREHVPLRTRIEDPEDAFDDSAGGNRLAAGSAGYNVLLRKVVPDAFPVLVA